MGIIYTDMLHFLYRKVIIQRTVRVDTPRLPIFRDKPVVLNYYKDFLKSIVMTRSTFIKARASVKFGYEKLRTSRHALPAAMLCITNYVTCDTEDG